MGCITEWDDNRRTVLRRTLYAPWSFHEIRQTEREVYAAVQDNGQDIGMIIHITEPFHLPTDALRNFQRQFLSAPTEILMTVFVVQPSPMVNMLFSIIERMGRHSNHLVLRTENMEEARHMICQRLEEHNNSASSQ
ncbi:MAG: hypothetical protein AAFV33_08615 [Chloroflexota bacterium]